MSLVTTINFNDITRDTSGGNQVSEFTQNSNVTYNGSTINTHRIRTTSTGSSTHLTFNVNKANFNNVLKNDNDLIRLNFDVYVKNLNGDLEIAECSIDGDVVLYQKGFSSDFTKKISVNYLIKSSRIAKLLDNDGFLVILFKLYSTDNQQRIGTGDYIYIDREIKVYAIYKPEFSSITGSNRTVDSTMTLDDSFDASSKTIANANACEIKGPGAGTSSGSVKFNLTNKLLDGKPINLFFNLNIDNFQNTDSLKIQIDNGSGTYVDYFEISQTANNNKLKTFFYSQTENYNSSNDFNIKFNLSGNIENGDFVYFDNMFTYIPEAINFFDASGINPSGTITLEPNLLINSNEYVGSIELFNSLPLPDNYLLCDGSEITKSDNDGNYYAPLIDLLNGNTSGNSCYLPNFLERHPLGVNSGVGISNYNSANSNHGGNNTLNINHFPSHNHNVSQDIDIDMSSYNISVNKTGNSSINFSGPSPTTADYEEGQRSSNNMPHDINIKQHTHNVLSNAVEEFARTTSINYNTNFTLVNSEIQNPKLSGSNTLENRENYDLELKSYKLYFGIRFR